ncbi:glycosyltransferase family 4 protein [Atopomonas sediminilitoris]|uniref:glycosyltransferase family 4 protein n=1 Tax=Atopomonas sediminilitoris TaxID=2919919 RepID=UPI001F4E67BB|nr:glycosyltransferase family 1 protein [Atopomonas sediminilitoris]MCJ8170204.1 glycosyltransferase family 1 protein [Atopomonas sediminilitoris]
MQTSAPSSLAIALISETFAPEINGVARVLLHLCEGLRQRGHRVQVIRPRQGQEPRRQDDTLLVRGAPIPGYPDLQWGVSAYHRLLRHWRRQRPDVLYVATEGPLGLSAVRAANKLGIPVLSGFHSNFQQYTAHYGLNWLGGLLARYLCWFHNRCQNTLTPSEPQQRLLHRMGIHKVAVLGHGVDATHFNPAQRKQSLREEWGVEQNTPVLLHVGRLAAEKNLTLLLRSYQALRERGHSPKLVLVGDGPLRSSLERDLPEAIFTGVLRGQALAEHYASADMFVFPSCSETFGNVLLEAMASGLAIVAIDHAAASLHVQPEHNGLLAQPEDELGFIEHVCTLYESSESRRRLRLNARKHATAQGWPTIVAAFEQHLLSLCQPAGTTTPAPSAAQVPLGESQRV